MQTVPLFMVAFIILTLLFIYNPVKCTAGTETACTACEDAKHREKKLNVCACKDGYYDDGS